MSGGGTYLGGGGMVQTMLGFKRVDGAESVTGCVERRGHRRRRWRCRRRLQHLVPASLAKVERASGAAGLTFVPGREGSGQGANHYIYMGDDDRSCMQNTYCHTC